MKLSDYAHAEVIRKHGKIKKSWSVSDQWYGETLVRVYEIPPEAHTEQGCPKYIRVSWNSYYNQPWEDAYASCDEVQPKTKTTWKVLT